MAGTLFEATNLPLKCWCLGLYLVAQDKDGLSTLNLGRPLGIAQNSAWLMTHTFMHAMLEAENCQPLGERVELDEAYWGGERRGGNRGRGVPGKYLFLAAVDTTEEGRPLRIKCSALDGFRKNTMARWAAQPLRNDGHVVSDGLSAFKEIDEAGIDHRVLVTGGGAARMGVVALQWINSILGNLKNSIHGAYPAIRGQHLPRELAEFNDRFKRRCDLTRLVDQLVWDAMRPPNAEPADQIDGGCLAIK